MTKCKEYKDVYPTLWKKFKKARARGDRVDFHRLWSKGREIYCQVTGDETARHHDLTKFIQDYKTRMHTKQRGKKQSRASMVAPLKNWHATFRKWCILPLKANYDPKLGGFLPIQRLNVDQSTLLVVGNSKKTYKYVVKREKNHNTWISQRANTLSLWRKTAKVGDDFSW